MQVCISLQTDNHASISPLSFLHFTGRMPFCRLTVQRQSTAGILKTEVKLYCNSAGDATISSGPIRYTLSDCPALIMPHRMQDTRIVADVAYLASCVCLSVGHNRDSCENGSGDRYFVWNVGPKNHVGC